MRWCVVVAIVVLPLFTGAVPSAGAADTGTAAPAPAKPAPKPGEWQVLVGGARVDGKRSISAVLSADAPIPGSFGPVTPQLVLRYRGGQPAAYVGFGTYVGEGELDAEVTFGEQPAERQKWTIAEDGQSAFVAGETFDFFERLKKVPKLSVRISRPRKEPVTVTFTLRETEAVLKALISTGVKYGG
jgi:hypothetical protein